MPWWAAPSSSGFIWRTSTWIRSSSRKCRRQKISAGSFIVCSPSDCRPGSLTGYGSRRRRTTFLSMQGRHGVAKGRRAIAHQGATIDPNHTVAVNNGAAPKGLERYSTQHLVRELVSRLDEDPTRDGLLKTPERVEKALTFLTRGYHQHPQEILCSALFDVDYDEMVMVKDIEMYSLCEHHMLPFFGKVHIAYIPNGKVVGLSKLPRLVDVFARRLQVQERLTLEIAETLMKVVQPQGVGVVIEARHLCMMMRGVEKQHSATVTSAMLGCFRDERPTRDEFLALLRNKNGNGI